MLPFNLHVLGLPLAFILSQDQTLRCNKSLTIDLKCVFNLLILSSLIQRTSSKTNKSFFKKDCKSNINIKPAMLISKSFLSIILKNFYLLIWRYKPSVLKRSQIYTVFINREKIYVYFK